MKERKIMRNRKRKERKVKRRSRNMKEERRAGNRHASMRARMKLWKYALTGTRGAYRRSALKSREAWPKLTIYGQERR